MSRFGNPTPGFLDAIDSGDAALKEGHFSGAAAWYVQAAWLAGCTNDRRDLRHYVSAAMVRLDHLMALCLLPSLGRTSQRGEDDRWTALRKVAERGYLLDSDVSFVLQLVGFLGADAAAKGDCAEAQRAWAVLLACPKLRNWDFEAIDEHLIAEGLHRHRAELATHPAATADVWLAMLERCRTPDLVHTLLETPRAVEEEAVRAALG